MFLVQRHRLCDRPCWVRQAPDNVANARTDQPAGTGCNRVMQEKQQLTMALNLSSVIILLIALYAVLPSASACCFSYFLNIIQDHPNLFVALPCIHISHNPSDYPALIYDRHAYHRPASDWPEDSGLEVHPQTSRHVHFLRVFALPGFSILPQRGCSDPMLSYLEFAGGW